MKNIRELTINSLKNFVYVFNYFNIFVIDIAEVTKYLDRELLKSPYFNEIWCFLFYFKYTYHFLILFYR